MFIYSAEFSLWILQKKKKDWRKEENYILIEKRPFINDYLITNSKFKFPNIFFNRLV